MGNLSLSLKVIVAFVILFGLCTEASSEICWEPYSVEEPSSGDDDKNGKSRGKKGKPPGKDKKDSGFTTSSGRCENDTPTPKPGPAGTPSVSVANSTSGTYTVSWSASANMKTSGPEASGYELAEYKNGSYVKKYTTSPTTRTYSISNNPDGNYQYKVRGCNLDYKMGVLVCGNYSSLSSITYVRHKPSTPAKPTINDTTVTGSVTVSWKKPSGSVSFYRIQKRKGSGSWSWADTNHTGTSLTVSGLTDGSWDFRVQACNGYTWSCSGLSSDSANTTVRVRPSIPATPTINDTTVTGSVTVSWTKPGGSVSFYRIQKRKNSGSWTWADSNHTSTSLTISGLTDGSWDFRVQACNQYSWACSSFSLDSTNTTVRNKPSKPSAPTLNDETVNNGSTTVSWIKPSGTVTFYRLEKRVNSGSWITAISSTTQTSFTETGMSDGSWQYRVQACNQYTWACSSLSNISSTAVLRKLPSTPSAPSVTSATSSDGSIAVSWSKPSGTVTKYDVIEYQSGVSGYTVVADNTSSLSLSLTGRGDGSYTYRVRACNEFDWSCTAYSSHSTSKSVLHKPGVPASINGPTTINADGSFSISWAAGTGQVERYETAHRHKPIGGIFGGWVYKNRGDVFNYSYSSLSDGEWDFAVKACNSSGCSDWRYISPHVQVIHKPGVPVSISGPTLTDVDGSHTITWGVASGQVDSYELRQRFKPYGNSSYGTWSTVYNSTGRSKYFSLLSDGEYDYAVRACNTSGCSNFKYISPRITVLKTPYKPNVSVDSASSDGTYTVSWQNGGGIVDEYFYSESPNFDNWIPVGNSKSRVISGKSDGSWSYKVKACNSSGCGGHGTSNTVTVNHPTPDTPSSINVPAETAETSYRISWEASTSTALDYYQISQQHAASAWSGWTKITGNSAQVVVDEAGNWKHRVRACNELPDNSHKCSSAKVSSEVDVKLPPDWAKPGGAVADQAYGHSEGLLTDETVGAVEGSGGVSGGAANYQIPIVIPPGRKGMQPNVSLAYSSRSGNGVAGFGWSLSAGSAISRCAATPAQDGSGSGVTYGSKDKLCLDGQRLIVVSGQYGASGSEYRTELDIFAKIVQSGSMNSSSSWFTVYHKNNTKSVYGSTSGSKHIASGRNEILSWAIANTQDPSGNTITYDYYNYSNGENLLKAIYYTGKNGSNGDREVRLNYEPRPDVSRSYMAGGLTTNSKRLKSLQTLYQAAVIREYKLTYELSPFSERSIIKEITECAGNVCLKPTKVSSYKPSYGWENTGSNSSANRELEETGKMVEPGDKLSYIDLNGDGVLEIIYTRLGLMQNDDEPVRTIIFARNEYGDYQEVANNTFVPLTTGDINLDGITDLLYVDQATNKIGYKQYNNNFQVESFLTDIPAPSSLFYANAKQLDVNNDGYPDLIYRDYTNNEIKYFLRASDGSVNFTGPYTFTTMRMRKPVAQAHIREEASYMDVDGDGYLDVLKTYLSDDTVLEVSVSFGSVSNNRWVPTNKTASQLGLPTNNFTNQYFFADLNGDGLQDFVRPIKVSTNNFDWRVRLNKGDRTFDTEKSLGTGLGIHEHKTRFKENGFVNKIQSRWGGATFADFDNDGRDELFTPTYSRDNLCTTFTGVPPSQVIWEPYSVEVCNDDMHIEEKVQLDSHPNLDIYIDFGQYDIRRFKWSIVDFKDTTSGLKYSKTIPDVVEAPITGFNSLDNKKSWSPIELKDLDNDGFIDFSYRTVENYSYSHCNPPPQGIAKQNCYLYVAGQPYHHAILGVAFREGSPPISGGYFEQKNLIGKNSNDGKLADTAYEIENGLGVKVGWSYAHLSKHLSRPFDANPLYYVPAPEVRYTAGDPKHFMFTSSMYVVSDSYHSNGVGSENQRRYSYREAVYNRMGRGFQGFRQISVDELSSDSRSVSNFHQKFPKAGKLESARTCLISDGDSSCLLNPISRTVVGDYHVKNTANSKVKWVFPTSSTKETFDLNSRSQPLSLEVSTISSGDVDIYGNVLKSVTTLDNGFDEIKTIVTKNYDVNQQTWWLNKLTKSRTDVSKIRAATVTSSAPGSDSSKWSQTTYSYNTGDEIHRVPTGIVTIASGSSQSHVSSISLNTFGLPTSVTTVAAKGANTGSALNRTVSTIYSADGYFPKTVTNPKGHHTTAIVSSKHGQPTSQTDANGITVTHTYDAFGRLKSSTVPGGKLIKKGYKWCYSSCPYQASAAVYYEFTQQEGSPTVKVYKDSFNRAVMTETQGFGGSSSIYTRTGYDELGRKTLETKPSFYSSSEIGTRYTGYDVLGRLLSKETDQADSYIMHSEYQYDSHKTNISVTDRGDLLTMRRTYASDGKLMKTTDAMGGETRYAYDSMGNPITLTDPNGNSIYAWHNGFGHKWKVSDPNMGVKTFAYNTYGEVESETDANGDKLTMRYDELGRLEYRWVNGTEQAHFEYDNRSNGIGMLGKETGQGIEKLYSYDGLTRPSSVTTTIGDKSYTSSTSYDGNYGRVKAYTYASGITVGYDYDDFGYQTKVYNAKSGYEYQKVEQRDALLNITEAYKNANSLRETRVYSEATGQLRNIYTHTSSGEHLKHNLGYTYGSFGNLSKQEQWSPSGISSESYGYDKLHRLINSSRSGFASDQASVTYEYDAVGNITHKSDYANSYSYTGSGGPNAVSSITKLDGSVVNFTYDANGNMRTGDGKTITYNAFNKPVTINVGGVTSAFNYGADLARYKQVKGTETTIYIGKEVDIILIGNTTTTKTYIDDIAIVSKRETVGKVVPDHEIRFVHRDRLGSVVTLTDHNNNIMEQRSYDAFGKPRTGEMKASLIPTLQGALSDTPYAMDVVTDIDRGFTDHEHLDDAQLIHMNGRAYDYNLGRFLSVDPFIQEPGNSQSMNPYSYIMNNPLAGTDPSGYRACYEDSSNCTIDDIEVGETIESVDKEGNIEGTITKREDGSLIVHQVADNGKDISVSYVSSDLKESYQIEQIGSEKFKDTNTFLSDFADAANASNPNNPLSIDGNMYTVSDDSAARDQRELAKGMGAYAAIVVGGGTVGRMVPPKMAGGSTGNQTSKLTNLRGKSSNVDDVVDSALRPARAGSQDSRALQALKKKVDRGDSAFSNLPTTQDAALEVIKKTLNSKNPIIRTKTRNGKAVRDVFDPSTGRGVRTIDGKFDTFINLK